MLFAVIQAFVITVTDIQFIYAKRCKLGTYPIFLIINIKYGMQLLYCLKVHELFSHVQVLERL